jgi:DNA-binding NtrC family response regulator
MEFAVLECRQVRQGWSYRATRVDSAQVKQLAGNGQSCLFYVSESQLSDLRKSLPNLRDLGTKLPRKELFRYFSIIDKNEIGVVHGEYKSARQLKRSACDVLRKCGERQQTVVAFVVLKPPVFSIAWQTAIDHPSSRSASRPMVAAMPDIERTLRTLGEIHVPEGLQQAYVGDAPSIRFVHQLILRASEQSCPVLIQGESGTGKEIIARSIHELSRAHGRGPEFRPINCSAISHYLVESELFGHVTGAFDGAIKDRDGLWKSANNGTIFLDEIGDLDLDHQTKILRALDTNRVKPVGSDKEVEVRARVISATNRDLYAMIKQGNFREDLYFRLSVSPIYTPPLREHPEDIRLIANWLWSDIAGKSAPRLTDEILNCLMEYTWPGNVRELKSILSSLRGYFGNRAKTREYFETVMLLKGQPAPVTQTPTARQAATRTRAASFQHLRRVDRVLWDVEVFLKPLRSRRNHTSHQTTTAQIALGERHRELLQFCQKPLLFSSAKSFEAVYSVCGKIAYLLDALATDASTTNQNTSRDLAKQLKSARALIQKQIDSLIPNSRNQRS